MSTESLRKDHHLIEKMLKALDTTAALLKSGKTIPAPILDQMIDFTKNFTLVCHHGKEEDSLFPALEKSGMPREGGPIARMLFEHEVTKQLASKLEESAKIYLQSGRADSLVADIKGYIDHVALHLAKENHRLFMMADMILQGKADQINRDLARSEEEKLKELGKTRSHYEKLVSDIELGLA
ncbi:putative hemerythrin HHE cation binding domain protein [Candidatus Nitrososphaera gargensis Ga9.2]|uniref:Putative hemerythrin HHE cation binding domain protein n=1 Tax=Nitrososphaera gargensis (strain Ga9.2) TaxID=1237085 RepID=K0IMV4_NITGG|nr:hemerythrin domain-containing protein [Candidatus Nitrososphaera gargensis]AFU58279.1 putative hemerythrin HHE cation binding domain protein [Candidatus Nitrososphaera gargensis Ga9.2]